MKKHGMSRGMWKRGQCLSNAKLGFVFTKVLIMEGTDSLLGEMLTLYQCQNK